MAFFTSRGKRRPAAKPAVEALEDRCVLDGSFGAWAAPVNLDPDITNPVVNSTASDQHPAISKDGPSLYITSNRSGGQGGDDIWVSQRASLDSPWGVPINLGSVVNSSGNDCVPTFSRDGHWMLFGSTRLGGLGGLDVWASYRQNVHDDFDWQAPINLRSVNSMADDDGATLFADDDTGITTLYFTSSRPQPDGTTDFDIYSSILLADGTFTAPTPVTELNNTGRDTRTAIRRDGLEIFITSDRTDLPGSQGGIDLWVSTRAAISDPWSTPVNLGPVVNTAANDGAPALSSDAQTLYFYSNRSGGVGGNDLYMTTRQKTPSSNCLVVQAISGSPAGAASALFAARQACSVQQEHVVVDALSGHEAAMATPIATSSLAPTRRLEAPADGLILDFVSDALPPVWQNGINGT